MANVNDASSARDRYEREHTVFEEPPGESGWKNSKILTIEYEA